MYNRIILKKINEFTTYNQFVCFTNFISVLIIWSYINFFALHFKIQKGKVKQISIQ